MSIWKQGYILDQPKNYQQPALQSSTSPAMSDKQLSALVSAIVNEQ